MRTTDSDDDRRLRSDGALRPRPALHFAPARGWMNDPNGLIDYGGRVHLFYQHNPAGPVHQNIAWGHASSTNLWSWQDHPLALSPDPDGPDRDGCYSGCAVVHGGRPFLLYTGVDGEHELPCLAEAADQDLVRWIRDPGNPVITGPPPGEAVRAFRDHSAWRNGSTWYQVIGGGLRDRGGAMFLYRSADLRHWQYVGVFAAAADHGLDGAVWECPDVFVLDNTTVVVVSVCDGEPPYAMWMTGQVSGQRFVPEVTGRCDGGHRYYAPQSLWMADRRRVAFGWLRECLDELTGADWSRVGVMSLPRELFLDGSGSLQARSARELDGARRKVLLDRPVHGRGTAALALSARAGGAAEISVTPVGRDVTAVGLRLAGPDDADVQIRVAAGGIEITEGGRRLTEAAPPPGAPPGAWAEPAGQVRVYYDGGILEVFGPPATAAAVICRRDGSYDRIEAELSARPGAPTGRASLTVWSTGRPPGSGTPAGYRGR
jgi:beta-fructofuranosidase